MRGRLSLSLMLFSAAASAQTVAGVAAQGRCSTAGVEAVSRQLVETQICLFPSVFVNVTPRTGISVSESRLFTLAQASTRDALWTAARTTPLQINSMFRTLADQYVLYHSGGCGLAARPGQSNHETGTAVDLANWSAALRAMTRAGCGHPYPGSDDVHFDCPGTDRRSDSVRAFQRLWNTNNPGDRITEDGAYGAMTEARLARSPAAGFARNGCATVPTTPAYAATLLRVSCPTEATSGDRPVAFVEYRNTGTATWDTTGTRLGTTSPRDRRGAFYDSVNWRSPSRPSTVDAPTAPGAVGRFSFVLLIPEVSVVQDLADTYALVQEGVTWFGPADDAVRCTVRVRPRGVDAGMAPPDVVIPPATDVPMDDVVDDVADAADADDADDDVRDASDAAGDVTDAGDVVTRTGDARVAGDGGVEELPPGCQCRTGNTSKPLGRKGLWLLTALLPLLRRRRRRS
ncbi:MAG: M15 family metallopeptidase [Polyangiales bacterium]